MPNEKSDTTLIQGLRLASGRFSPAARLYYYQGNFYWPFLSLHGGEVSRVKKAMREFIKANRQQFIADREAAGYRNIVQLFDEQMEVYANA